ncbi:MAG: ABC transporter ATP-binding protein [Candidatus Dormibacteraeota bacterium]|nr:ABC transporter ATP-binding protein [Candidatus Dormibacteraeota bacterium]
MIATLNSRLRRIDLRDRSTQVYVGLFVVALLFPGIVQFLTGGNGLFLVSTAADAGVYILLALGLNVVVGFAGLLDLGYAAFFAIGAYTFAMLASNRLAAAPLHHAVHIPFWFLLLVAVCVAAIFGVLLGAPTLRLRGDYLAIVTLGFGEIVPRVFRNLTSWTGGVNGISALDAPTLPAWINGPWAGLDFSIERDYQFIDPTQFYVAMIILLVIVLILINNLYRSRLGRAWMAVREDETAAAAMGINTVTTKLLAFAIGASFSGFAGCFYGAKLSLVSPDNFSFVVSVTILLMVVLGGMGNVPGVIVGALTIYIIDFYVLTNLPNWSQSAANAVGLGFLNQSHGAWGGLQAETQNLIYLVFGLILVSVMLLRPQGLLPSRVRQEELTHTAAAETAAV